MRLVWPNDWEIEGMDWRMAELYGEGDYPFAHIWREGAGKERVWMASTFDTALNGDSFPSLVRAMIALEEWAEHDGYTLDIFWPEWEGGSP